MIPILRIKVSVFAFVKNFADKYYEEEPNSIDWLFVSVWICYGTSKRRHCRVSENCQFSQPTVLLYLPYSPEITEKAFYNYLSKTTNKEQKEAPGFLLSTNTSLAKSNVSDADMHFFIGNR
jgi:hypothetical protein